MEGSIMSNAALMSEKDNENHFFMQFQTQYPAELWVKMFKYSAEGGMLIEVGP